MVPKKPRGSGCLGAVVALVLGVAGLAVAPFILLQQANGVTLERPLAYGGVPLDNHGGQPSGSSHLEACGDVPEVAPNVALATPLKGLVSSPFGWRPNPTGWGWDCHTGVDWAVEPGTPVRAAAAGRVVTAGYAGNYGILVRLDHGRGVETWYGHLSATAVETGQDISAGAVIGWAGSTGRSTGPHLHFEVRIDGRPVNPLRALAGEEDGFVW